MVHVSTNLIEDLRRATASIDLMLMNVTTE
jgi:hypothetical protein